MSDLVQDAPDAARWIAEALTSSGYVADFSPASLGEVDRFFDEQSDGGRPRPGGLLAADTGRRLFALGAYVGEVLLRELGGSWRAPEAAPDSEEGLMVVLPDGSVVWPIERALKRFVEGAENGIAAYGVALGVPVRTARPEGTATLISKSCTTGWLDWVHGELWLGEEAIMRSRLSLAETLAHGNGGSPTVTIPPARVPLPSHLTPPLLAAGHRRNKYLPFAQIAAAALHRGRMNDRLSVTMDTGARHKLLWLSTDPAFAFLREALARSLPGRLTVD